VLLLLSTALAGTLVIRDDANVLPPAASDTLRHEVAGYRFDTIVLTETQAASLAGLQGDAARLRTSENQLVIAVDPEHRHTDVEFGSDVGVRKASFDAVRAAGDASFRAGDWAAGVSAIAQAAAHPPASFGASDVFIVVLGAGFIVLCILYSDRLRPARGFGTSSDSAWSSGDSGGGSGGGDSGSSGGSW
jgi:hypothetical protein